MTIITKKSGSRGILTALIAGNMQWLRMYLQVCSWRKTNAGA
jgi:hypothetical protein